MDDALRAALAQERIDLLTRMTQVLRAELDQARRALAAYDVASNRMRAALWDLGEKTADPALLAIIKKGLGDDH